MLIDRKQIAKLAGKSVSWVNSRSLYDRNFPKHSGYRQVKGGQSRVYHPDAIAAYLAKYGDSRNYESCRVYSKKAAQPDPADVFNAQAKSFLSSPLTKAAQETKKIRLANARKNITPNKHIRLIGDFDKKENHEPKKRNHPKHSRLEPNGLNRA